MTINWDSQVLSTVSKVIPHLSSIKINTEQLNEVGAHLSKEDFLKKLQNIIYKEIDFLD